MFGKVIGTIVSLVGIACWVIALYIFVGQPMRQGDPDGVIVKVLILAVGGFLALFIGYAMAEPEAFEGKKIEDKKEPKQPRTPAR